MRDFFMLGFPTETPEEIRATLDFEFLGRHGDHVPLRRPGIRTRLTPSLFFGLEGPWRVYALVAMGPRISV